jgi:hypothetical protein
MTLAMLSRLCVKLAQCDNDDDMAKTMCEALASSPTPAPPNCPAAARCLAHIDGMSCSGQGPLFAQLNQLVLQLQDCMDADHC